MALMKSCCCFKSIRNGSFASAIYTMIFYVIVMTACTFHIHTVYEHSEMLAFTLVMVCLSSVMVITSILLLIGLCAENGQLFIPWLITITLTTSCDVLLSLYLLLHSEMDPFKAALFVIDFFICGINVFCFLCVFSYYQQCHGQMLHLKYVTPPSNTRNNFEDLKKYDGSKPLAKNQSPNHKRDQHLAQKNSHFVELSTISEDNEQISSEKNTTVGANEDFRRLISEYDNDYKTELTQMTGLLSSMDSRLVSSMAAKLDDMDIDSIKKNSNFESIV